MQPYRNPGVSFDTAGFHPMRIMPVRHELMGHPLFQLSNLLDLAKRLEPRGLVRRHDGDVQPSTNFTTAPDDHPTRFGVEDTIRRIEEANSWMALHNIQEDSVYRGLVDEVLDYVRPMVEPRDPGMCHRAGWIFITSPGAVTPYHMDHEHNFILQILGKKTLHVFDPLDRSIVTERSLELFHMKLSRELVVYKPEFAEKAHVFELEPGMGGYMPTTAPHWVKNGDGVSITASFTYYTRRTLRQKLLHRGNYALRELGLEPTPVGRSRVHDAAKAALFQAQVSAKGVIRRLRGTQAPNLMGRYAVI
jgi:hypothetical protein